MRRQTAPDLRTNAPPSEYDDRALRRLRHKDLKGLVGLMDDYQALGDELEDIGTRDSDPGGPPSRRAA